MHISWEFCNATWSAGEESLLFILSGPPWLYNCCCSVLFSRASDFACFFRERNFASYSAWTVAWSCFISRLLSFDVVSSSSDIVNICSWNLCDCSWESRSFCSNSLISSCEHWFFFIATEMAISASFSERWSDEFSSARLSNWALNSFISFARSEDDWARASFIAAILLCLAASLHACSILSLLLLNSSSSSTFSFRAFSRVMLISSSSTFSFMPSTFCVDSSFSASSDDPLASVNFCRCSLIVFCSLDSRFSRSSAIVEARILCSISPRISSSLRLVLSISSSAAWSSCWVSASSILRLRTFSFRVFDSSIDSCSASFSIAVSFCEIILLSEDGLTLRCSNRFLSSSMIFRWKETFSSKTSFIFVFISSRSFSRAAWSSFCNSCAIFSRPNLSASYWADSNCSLTFSNSSTTA